MNLEDEQPQKSARAERERESRGAAPRAPQREGTSTAGRGNERSGSRAELMEEVTSVRNLQAALKRVETNKGSPGIDGMRTDELRLHLRANWKDLTRALLDETYRPQEIFGNSNSLISLLLGLLYGSLQRLSFLANRTGFRETSDNSILRCL